MRLLAIAGHITALGCLAQAQPIAVPAGTKIPLTLTSPLSTRMARVGDSVRAATAFPVAVNGKVAIPLGTFVEGAIDKVTRHGRHSGFQIRFSSIIFDNGYTVPLSGSSTAVLTAGMTSPELPAADGTPTGMANSLQALPAPAQQTSTLTTPAAPGPNKGLIIGLAATGVAAAIVTAVVLGSHSGGLYLDVGSPVDLVLSKPLSLDAAKLPAAAATP